MDDRDELSALADMSEIDAEILGRSGEDDLLDKMQEQKDKQTAIRAPWREEIKKHPFAYLLLFLSFLLTEMAAIYLGTSPTLVSNPDGSRYIRFNTDAGHLLTTLIYLIVFPAVTELAFGVFRNKFNKRETGNNPQQFSMGLAAAVALIAVIGTGVSGAFVIFSTLGSIGFVEVPASVQTWLIWVIPCLIAFYALMYWIYEANSDEEKAKRLGEEQDRRAEIADNLRMREIDRIAKRAIKAEAIRAYKGSVAKGLLSDREALDGLSQGLSLVELEKKLRRDLTGDGKIGEHTPPALPSPAQSPAPGISIPHPVAAPQSTYRAYTLTELLAYMSDLGVSREQLREMIRIYNLFDATSAFYALRDNGYLPRDFGSDEAAVDRFRGLYSELMGYTSTALPPAQRKVSNP